MALSTPELRRRLRRLHEERRALLRRLTRHHDVAVGSVSVVRRKCGKPTCHCAQGVGHPQTLFLFKGEDGRRRCKLVRQDDSQEMLRAGERYREFRSDLRKLRTLNRREERILVALMEKGAVTYE